MYFVASLQDALANGGVVPGVTTSLRSVSTPGYFHIVPPGRGWCVRCGPRGDWILAGCISTRPYRTRSRAVGLFPGLPLRFAQCPPRAIFTSSLRDEDGALCVVCRETGFWPSVFRRCPTGRARECVFL